MNMNDDAWSVVCGFLDVPALVALSGVNRHLCAIARSTDVPALAVLASGVHPAWPRLPLVDRDSPFGLDLCRLLQMHVPGMEDIHQRPVLALHRRLLVGVETLERENKVHIDEAEIEIEGVAQHAQRLFDNAPTDEVPGYGMLDAVQEWQDGVRDADGLLSLCLDGLDELKERAEQLVRLRAMLDRCPVKRKRSQQ